jgi:hypothetical protein
MGAPQSHHRWRWFFILAAVEASVAVLAMAAIPGEGAFPSAARTAMLVFLAGCGVTGIVLAARPPRDADFDGVRIALPASAVASGAAAAALFLIRYLEPATLLPYYHRLAPLLWFILALSGQALVFLLIGRYGLHWHSLNHDRRLWVPGLVAIAILLSVLTLTSITRLGITPDPAYWGEPGVPMLGWQLALAICAGLAVLLLSNRNTESKTLNAVLAVAIWVVAIVAWLGVPIDVVQNSFYAPIRPPTNQPFPNSDAGYYDSMAQSLIIGYPYQGEIPSRPLYVVLLWSLHALLGERYDLIIGAQALLLALIPVVLFFLGKALHSGAAGVIAALAAVGREWTSLLVSSETRVSNTKMLLVDLPTLLVILACCLFTLRWFKSQDRRAAAIAGGMFGLLLLLRTQAAILLPVVVLLWLLVIGGRAAQRADYRPLLVFLGLVMLTILPWLIRNYLATGQFSIDAPFQYRIIASQYRYTGNLDIDNVELEGQSVLGTLIAFAVRDPSFVFGFIANHALATQIGGVLALPLFHDYNGLGADINLYWLNWDERLSLANMVLIVIYLCIIGFGLGRAWNRMRWIGLVPLGFSLAYSAANGIARFSGWRYDLPADWVAYFYFAVGAAEILTVLAALFGADMSPEVSTPWPSGSHRPRGSPLVPVGALFLAIGLLPWFVTLIVQPRYAAVSRAELVAKLAAAPEVEAAGISEAEVKSFASSPHAVLEIGRVLYPRFFRRDNGLASTNPWPAYAPRDYPRLGFLMLNRARLDVILPIRESPQDFQHADDAIILGCPSGDYLEARLVLFVDSGSVFQGAALSRPCP